MRVLLPALLVLSACNFDTSTSAESSDPFAPDNGGPNRPDADPAAPDADTTFLCSDWNLQPTILSPCDDISIQLGTLSLAVAGTYRYNTTTGTLTNNLGSVVPNESIILTDAPQMPRVLVANDFYLAAGSGLRVVGDRPLIIAAWGNIVVDGLIDASSSQGEAGAGADYADCSPATPGSPDSDGSGGGGGGGFARPGGTGGLGRSPNEDIAGGPGGDALPIQFHGGCPGADGGDEDSPSSAGAGASGGGGVYLLARLSLTIRGTLDVGGQGGLASTGSRSGGGGGGSGGMIGLEADTLVLEASAVIVSNGGGGGGGTKSDGNATAESGLDGSPNIDSGNGGGGEESPAADGGQGGKLGVLAADQDGLLSDRGGGGGGGSYGFVLLRTNGLQNDGAAISPMPTTTSISAQ